MLLWSRHRAFEFTFLTCHALVVATTCVLIDISEVSCARGLRAVSFSLDFQLVILSLSQNNVFECTCLTCHALVVSKPCILMYIYHVSGACGPNTIDLDVCVSSFSCSCGLNTMSCNSCFWCFMLLWSQHMLFELIFLTRHALVVSKLFVLIHFLTCNALMVQTLVIWTWHLWFIMLLWSQTVYFH